MAKPWERDWSQPQTSQKPWERDWSGNQTSQPEQPQQQPYDYSNIPQVASDLVKSNVDALPQYGMVAGSVLSGGNPAGAGAGQAVGQSIKDAAYGVKDAIMHPQKFIDSLHQLPTKEQVIDQVNKYMSQFNQGATAEVAGQTVGKIADVAAEAAPEVKNAALNMAKRATGATRAQAQKFGPNSSQAVLDNLKFGDTPQDVATTLETKIKGAENNIDTALQNVDSKGVKVSQNSIVDNVQKQIDSLRESPANAGLVKNLEKEVENIKATGQDEILPSKAEQFKRDYNTKKTNWQDPEQGQSAKILYRAYRDAVEGAAKQADPEAAALFKSGKETFGSLIKPQQAASARALQLNQSPLGGFMDVTTAAGTGAAVGGIKGLATGVAVAAARRAIAPRIASSSAVTLDAVASQLKNIAPYAKMASEQPEAFASLANNVYEQFKNPEKTDEPSQPQQNSLAIKGPAKWQQDGAQKLIDSGVPKEQIEKLKLDKKGQDLLVQAANGDKALKAVVDKLKADRGPANTYPLTLRKNGHTTTVLDDQEFKEATSEGWTK
jgi:hypothetical protein